MRTARAPALLLALLAAGCGEGETRVPTRPSDGPVTPGTWASVAPMAEARQEVCVGAIGSRLFVAGGFRADRSTAATLEVYDTATDRWSFGAPMPEALNHCTAAVVESRFHVLGGATGSGAASGRVFAYDPQDNTWRTLTSMPTARSAATAAVIAGRIYVAGGAPDGTALEAYDPARDAWAVLPRMPTARNHLAGGASGGRLFAVGGRPPNTLSAVETFDPASATWAARQRMPTGRSGHAAAVVSGCLYTFGGEGNAAAANGMFPQVEVYDPRADRWEALSTMPVPKHGIGAAVVNGRIFIPGGATVEGFGAVATMEVFTPPSDRRCE